MLFEADSYGFKEPHIRRGRDSRMGRSNFWGCPAHCKAPRVSAAVYAAKGIIQSTITTAAADCNARDWSVSHYIVPREKSSAPAMRPFVKIL